MWDRVKRVPSGTIVGSLGAVLLAASASYSFVDRTRESGINAKIEFGPPGKTEFIYESMGAGVAIADFDGDGANDIFFATGIAAGEKRTALPKLYLNRGDGTFADQAEKWGLSEGGWQQGVCAGDLDNDGRIDLFVARLGHSLLYRNETSGFRAKPLPQRASHWDAACAMVDFDRDGLLDIFVSSYVGSTPDALPKPGANENCLWRGVPVFCGPKGLPVAKNTLYRNLGGWKFEDVSEKSGIRKPGGRYGLGVVAADFDNDGWPDIYVACDQTPSLLYRNNRDGTFTERGVEAGVAYNFDGQLQSGMGVAVADFDGNGFLDIAKTNFSGDLPSLYLNEDGNFFRDVSREAGLGVHKLLGWGVAFVDIDEDGWPDLAMVNGHVYPEVDRMQGGETYRQRSLLFRNLGNGKFADITMSAGPAFQTMRPSRGLATGDLDGDGRPEIVIANVNESPSLLKNGGARGSWIRIELEGTKSNRSGIGARVTVEYGGRKQIDELRAGGSYYSQHEMALNFGIGSALQVQISIDWPSGIRQQVRSPANRTIKIREAAPEQIDAKR